ncbi:MAG TPA: hydrolase [Candidatus Binatia bacterium]|nr:hydrolase [Candidatus Binatia bacterium]
MLTLVPTRTALVLIDVQKGTLGFTLAPHSAPDVTQTAVRLAQQCRQSGATLVYVRVGFSDGFVDRPGGAIDTPMMLPPDGLPKDWSDYAPEVAAIAPDLWITKRQWSAFHGTELDLQLRRRGITHMILGGIATNFGVESTARDGWQNNYTVVIAEDACSSMSDELHRFAIEKTLPRVSLVRGSAEIIAALAAVS